jgi:hypothetical protein
VFEACTDVELIEVMGEAGHTYTTTAHGAALFPTLAQSTGELNPPTLQPPGADSTVMMPRRKQTQAWLAQNYQPPPF